MNMKKKFLILTADAGYGHRSASLAIASALNDLYGEACEINILNPVYQPSAPYIFRKTQADYDKTVRNQQAFYLFTYKISDSRPASAVVKNVSAVLLYKTMQEILAEYQPDGVISTFELYQSSVGAVLARSSEYIPSFLVITDLADVHKLWLQNSPAKIFVPSDHVRAEALAAGLPEDKIVVSGIPVNPDIFCEKRSKIKVRESLGWELFPTTILAVSSRRVERMYNFLEAIHLCGLPIQLAVVTGGDEILFDRLKKVDWRIPVHLYNQVDNVAEMMLASDILVSKAGGLILSEGMACGLPILMVDALPGQEAGNVNFVTHNQAGVMVSNPEELVRTLNTWLDGDQKMLKIFSARSRQLGRPDAAYQIAEIVWETVQNRTPALHASIPGIRD